jgi:hypothetical protein
MNVKAMYHEEISIKCRKVGDYSVEICSIGWWDEFTVTRNSDGMPVLFVILNKEDEDNPTMMSATARWRRMQPTPLSEMDVFDIIATETLTMRNILSRILGAVKERESGFITIDSMNYDGTGVELEAQFGYMTGGEKTNLSTMSVEVSPVLVFADVDCNITLCCVMTYTRDGKGDERLVRLGSGKGVDEAVSNAKRRIESIIEGMNRIDEYLFGRLCIGCSEKEQSEAIF